jgi:hypothetical protein
MGRWHVTRPLKASFPSKPAMFEAMREKLGIGGRFTCQGTNGRQARPERTYEITEYGFNWAEEPPRQRAKVSKEAAATHGVARPARSTSRS